MEIRTTAQGIRNPTNEWNQESKCYWQRLSVIQYRQSGIHEWNLESKNVLDFLIRGNKRQHKWFFAELISGKEGYIPPRAYFLIPLYPLSWTATANTLSRSHEINEQLLKTELILLIRGWNNTQDLRWLTKMCDPCFWKGLRTVKHSSLLRQGRKTVG